MQNHDILSVASRRTIFDCVGEHAGAHLRDVARRCGMPLGTTLYHLDCLEQAGLVVARRDGRYKRYFAAHGLGRREKEVLSLLRHSAPRRIVAALLERGPSTQRELCAAIGVSRSTLSFHINRLVVEGVAQRLDARPESRYRLVEPDLAQQLLGKFRVSLDPAAPAEASPQPAPDADPAGSPTVATTTLAVV